MTDEGVDESKRATLRRFAALGAASPLVRFAQDSESDALVCHWQSIGGTD